MADTVVVAAPDQAGDDDMANFGRDDGKNEGREFGAARGINRGEDGSYLCAA